MGKEENSGRTQVSLIRTCAVIRGLVTRSLVAFTELALQLMVNIFLSLGVLQHIQRWHQLVILNFSSTNKWTDESESRPGRIQLGNYTQGINCAPPLGVMRELKSVGC